MSRVLVTGATTPIGMSIVRGLSDAGAELVLGVAGPDESRLEPWSDRVRFVAFDLTRSREAWALMFGPGAELRIDTVVHTALHRSASDFGRRVRALNVGSTRELLHLSERHPTVRRFVQRSFVDVYRIRAEEPTILEEDHPVELSPKTPQWIRDRVEADLSVCVRMGMSRLSVAVLRAAECLAPSSGSQLYDFFRARVCLRPLGFDPILNLASPDDIARAVSLAVSSNVNGVFNIPGRDTLPLSEAIRLAGRPDVPVPGSILAPWYRLRGALADSEFRYDQNASRFHYGGVLSGRRAKEVFGYEPRTSMDWDAIRRMRP
ncbi:MAG: NAD-dependent epimerase/dehydratase family protein [Deltaproteobacteria bacterium]|nr:NAD-dependent epimerase/dehydratase family protein [Deltaproteobacteria bacterium]